MLTMNKHTYISQREYARKKLGNNLYNFYFNDCSNGDTIRRNRKSLDKILLRPNICKNVDERKLDGKFLNFNVSMPIGIGPTSNHGVIEREGEYLTAKTALDFNIPFVLSTFSNISYEKIGKLKNLIFFMQVQFLYPREIFFEEVRKYENSNYIKGLVLTLDTPVISISKPLIDLKSNAIKINPQPNANKAFFHNQEKLKVNLNAFRAYYTWQDIKELVNFTKLPIILKGIITPENALLACQCGIKAIWVSNHGGRKMSSLPSTVDALKEIIPIAKEHTIPVFVDGGCESGSDVLKFLALGANFVFLGKAILAGLANGSDGLSNLLRVIKDDFSCHMAMCGYKNIDEIDKDCIWSNRSKL